MKLIHILVFNVLVFTSELALAQQTIINVPSDALTPKGSHFVLHESQFSPRSKKATYTTTNFYTYGLTDNTELAATLYSVDNFGSELGALGLGWKSTYEVFQEEMPELKVKWTSGFMLPISVEKTHDQVGWFPYSHVTFAIPDTEFRLLMGAAAGSNNLFGEQAASALAGVEYPITEHWSFTGEWFSGNHNLSGLIPGFTYHNKDRMFVIGYKLPNNFDPRENALVVEGGVFWGGSKSKDDRPAISHYGIRE